MTIYIDPFWAGFTLGALTVATLVITLVIYCCIRINKKKGS